MNGPKSNERRCHFTFRVTHTVWCPVEHFQIKWEQFFLCLGQNRHPLSIWNNRVNVLKSGKNLPSMFHRAWVWTFEVISFQSSDEFWREIQFVLFFWRQRAFVHFETTELFLSKENMTSYIWRFLLYFWRFLCQNILTNKSPCRGYTSFVCAVLRLAADAELKKEKKKKSRFTVSQDLAS